MRPMAITLKIVSNFTGKDVSLEIAGSIYNVS